MRARRVAVVRAVGVHEDFEVLSVVQAVELGRQVGHRVVAEVERVVAHADARRCAARPGIGKGLDGRVPVGQRGGALGPVHQPVGVVVVRHQDERRRCLVVDRIVQAGRDLRAQLGHALPAGDVRLFAEQPHHGRHEVRVVAQALLELRDGGLRLPGHHVGHAEVAAREHLARMQLEGLLEHLEGRVVAALADVRRFLFGHRLQRELVQLFRFVEAHRRALQRGADAVERRHRFGVRQGPGPHFDCRMAHGALHRRDGLFVAAAGDQRARQQIGRLEVGRIGLGLLQRSQRAGPVLLVGADLPDVLVGGDVAGVQLQCLAELLDSLFEAVLLHVDRAGVVPCRG